MTAEQENVQLKIENAKLRAQVEELSRRLKILEDKLAKDSHNSSKPPSSDGYKRSPKKRSLKKASDKQSGGQAEHPGHALRQVEIPDRQVQHLPQSCESCHKDLTQVKAVLTERRQVFELPPLKLEVTEHQTFSRCCPHCQTTTQATFPEGITNWVQYGPGFRALAVYLNQYQLLPYARTTEILNELFSQSFSEGTLASLLEECYNLLAEPEQAIQKALIQSDVAHFDETGGRVEGKLPWFHVVSTALLTYYRCHPKRGKTATAEIGILPQFEGIAVHDGWSTYPQYDCQHALCNAHHLRELTFVHEQLAQHWAGELKKLLVELKDEVTQAQLKGQSELNPELLQSYQLRYQKLLLVGLQANPPPPTEESKVKAGRKKQSKARNLLDRLHYKQREVLAFATDFKVPFDNNQAERDLRMLKVQQKIAGCFRTKLGAAIFCRIRGYVSTMRKHGHNPFTALLWAFKGKPLFPALA
jgi:transposase